MKYLASLLLFCLPALAQVFPGGIMTDATAGVARNLALTTLNGGVSTNATSLTLTSATGFGSNMVIGVGDAPDGVANLEFFFCGTLSGVTYSGTCTPHYDGSTTHTHASGSIVKGLITAAYLNALRLEIEAIETALFNGTAGAGNWIHQGSSNGLINTRSDGLMNLWSINDGTHYPILDFAQGPTNAPGSYIPRFTIYTLPDGSLLDFGYYDNAGAIIGNAISINRATGAVYVPNLQATTSFTPPYGTSNPATCVVPQVFFRTDSTAGRNWWFCTATNTWTQQLNSGGSGGGNDSHTITTSTTPTFDRLAPNQVWNFTISTSNSTASTSGLTAGDVVYFNLTQSATVGGTNFTWPSGFSEGCTIAAGNAFTGIANISIHQAFTWDGSTAHAATTCVTTASAPGTGLLRGDVPGATELSGDAVTTGSNVVVVPRVNGITHSATIAAHSVEVITTANATATGKVIPDCQDTGGNHLNFAQSGDTFSCGTSSSGGGGGSGGGVNARTVDYTLLSGDAGKLVTMNGVSKTVTLLATPSSTYAVGIKNLNASPMTIARNGLTINGGTSNITLQQYQAVACFADSTPAYTCDVPHTAGSGITLTPSVNGLAISAAATPYPAAGTSITLTGPRQYAECSSTCTVTPPTPPVAGTTYEFCIANAPGVSTVITLAAVSGVIYEKADFSGYGTANTAATSNGAVGNAICLLSRDATHYEVRGVTGTWSMP